MPHGIVDDRWIGQTLAGAYLIEERLGKGGMGAVYKARHVRTGGLRAIKILLPEAAADPEIYRRFADEAKITSALRHPHIVQVADFDQADDTPFIAMEYLDGVTLNTRVRHHGPLSLAEGVEFLRQVGSALQAAHDAGVVHRDIKPQNILLCRYQLAGKEALMTKVLDFGISHIRRSVSMMTRDTTILGTPQFMAPEMARGRNSELDGRADQFSLAVVLYYAFTGHRPFDSDDLIAVLHQVIYEEPEPLAKLAPHLPAHTIAAIERALSKRKDDRFASMLDFVHAVENAPLVAANIAPAAVAPAPAPSPARPSSTEAVTVSKHQLTEERAPTLPAAPAFTLASAPASVPAPAAEIAVARRPRWPLALGGLLLVSGAAFLAIELTPAPSPPPVIARNAEPPKAPPDLAPAVAAALAAPTPPVAPPTKGAASAKHAAIGRRSGTAPEKSLPIPAASPSGSPASASDRKIAEGEKKPPTGAPPIAPSSLTQPGTAPSSSSLPPADPKVALATPPPTLSPPAAVSPPPTPEDVKAACDQGETQKARNLYRRLEPRQRDFVQFYCGRLDIDVTSRAPAPPPVDPAAAARPPARPQPTQQELAQLIQQAREVLEADPKQASRLLGPAIESGSGAAWLLYGMAACKQHSKSESFASYKQLDVSKRQELIEYCAAARFPLR